MSDAQRGSWIPESINPQQYQSVLQVLSSACREHADKPAFNSLGQTLSFEELDHYSDAFACYLQRETDLQPGDRIAIQLPNTLQYPVVLFAALKVGLVVVNTNPLYTPRELEHQFNDAGVKALVVYQGVAHSVEKIVANTSLKWIFTTQLADLHSFAKRHVINTLVKRVKKMVPAYQLPSELSFRRCLMRYLGQKPELVECQPSSLAVLQYTGGTTGVAKGVMLSHANLVSNMLQAKQVIGLAQPGWSEVLIAPLPLYHIYAFTVSLVMLEAGGQSVLIANPRDIPAFVKELKKWRFSSFLGLNTLFVALCRAEHFDKLDFSNLKVTISGGMALTQHSAEVWHGATGCRIMEGYGLTEASPVVAANLPTDTMLGTIGYALPETQLHILSEEGEPLADGEAGELCLHGPQVMQGYWQRQEETDKVFTAQGFLRTGDVALRDEHGRYRIVDRAKDLIIVSGFNVYPTEVEDVISSHPEVIECAAIGIDNGDSGERIMLFVVREGDSLEAQALIAWCREQLTSYKVPREVAFVDELPKSNVGKVLRRVLRDEYNG
ncbi:MAG: AMP-binding protein [Pseudomonadales bacterium]